MGDRLGTPGAKMARGSRDLVIFIKNLDLAKFQRKWQEVHGTFHFLKPKESTGALAPESIWFQNWWEPKLFFRKLNFMVTIVLHGGTEKNFMKFKGHTLIAFLRQSHFCFCCSILAGR